MHYCLLIKRTDSKDPVYFPYHCLHQLRCPSQINKKFFKRILQCRSLVCFSFYNFSFLAFLLFLICAINSLSFSSFFTFYHHFWIMISLISFLFEIILVALVLCAGQNYLLERSTVISVFVFYSLSIFQATLFFFLLKNWPCPSVWVFFQREPKRLSLRSKNSTRMLRKAPLPRSGRTPDGRVGIVWGRITWPDQVSK